MRTVSDYVSVAAIASVYDPSSVSEGGGNEPKSGLPTTKWNGIKQVSEDVFVDWPSEIRMGRCNVYVEFLDCLGIFHQIIDYMSHMYMSTFIEIDYFRNIFL